jgi:adenylate cyclase
LSADVNNKKPVGVKFPISVKLVTIITILLLLSLGTITVLVSVMVSNDLRITAEENNFTSNQRSSVEAENTLTEVRSSVLMLLDILNAAGGQAALARQASAFFFERNQNIAAIVITGNREILNNRFLLSNEIDTDQVTAFLNQQEDVIERSKGGETVLVNAAPVFRNPILGLFFPWDEGGENEVVTILFSTETLNDSFGQGINSSFMINDSGD